ncbi:AMP-binding protein [Amycolatopsis sp. NBC_01488]|uniref:AMP-binding protein n=1 Tax=Amycolatopsis sp. NBC_01488 TaxID=2903563 RepID=UPI002E2ABC28|nr:AMP-binding protein [Amycolatopsis sp. NBC_01488]
MNRRSEPVRRRLTSLADVAAVESCPPEDLRPADTILGCLSAAAALDPEKPAIVLVEPPDFLAPARIVTYRELVREVELSARLFRACGGVIALMLPMVPEGLTALWGAATSGVAVPLNPFLEPASLHRILNEVGATTLVTTPEIAEGKEDPRDHVPSLRHVFHVGDDFAAAVRAHEDDVQVFDPDPDRMVMAMPTGGTTGTPKLVRMTQRGQLTVAWNVGALMGSERAGVVGHGMPNFHCGGSLSLGLRAMLFGQTLLTLTTAGFRSREVVASFWDIARHYRITSLLATPTTARAILDAGGDAEGHCLADFHVGGSQLPVALATEFHDRFGVWLRENWGMTELHGTITGHYNDGTRPRIGSAGRALPHFRVRAVELDGAGGVVRECAPGERGALVIGGPSVTDGYLDSAQDAALHVRYEGTRWADTGDLGTVDEDGYVWISGRAKDLIIRGGHNIDPGQIEEALSRHPDVSMAAAVGRPAAGKGEVPVAYVELKNGAAARPEALLAFCRAHVQERAAVPVEVVVLERLPVTPVGKVAKPALRRDALRREIRALVAELSGREHDHGVHVEDSGPRPRVIVSLPEGGRGFADLLSSRLAAYEFLSEVRVG